jgi:hypothetical protein
MAVYMVERDLKGIPTDQLAAAQKAAIETGKKMTAEGKSICLFEAPSQQSVKELNDTAKLSYNCIVEALDLTP